MGGWKMKFATLTQDVDYTCPSVHEHLAMKIEWQ
jgi:hypothetical protein